MRATVKIADIVLCSVQKKKMTLVVLGFVVTLSTCFASLSTKGSVIAQACHGTCTRSPSAYPPGMFKPEDVVQLRHEA